MKKPKKKWNSTTVLILVFLIGLSVLLYPTMSNYWNATRQSHAIISYAETVAQMDESDIEQALEQAQSYNQWIASFRQQMLTGAPVGERYRAQLALSDGTVMGYIEIPRIRVSLPIYHGTDETVLQEGAGHIEGSSLPVGGPNTHCVLSGHRGLPSSKLFTDLDQLELGDTFTLSVLNETLTYQVDQVKIVLPEETKDLNIVPGQDYCTLVTCTPYGVNTHRLLVRGIRTDTPEQLRVAADAIQIDPVLVAPVVAAPILLLLLLLLIGSPRRRK